MKIKAFALLLTVLTSGLAGISHAQNKEGEKPKAPLGVIVAEARAREISEEIEALGTALANESVDITSTVTATIERIGFDEGQQIKQGDLLVSLDTREERANLKAAKGTLTERQKALSRVQDLEKKQFAARATVDERRAALQEATGQIEAIGARIGERTITAPFSGILGLRHVSVGSLVTPGDLITTLDDLSQIKVDFNVPETFLSDIKEGLGIKARTDAWPQQAFGGRIATISPRIDPVTRAVSVRAVFPNEQLLLRPGMLMRLQVQKNPHVALVIPEESLIPRGRDNSVFVAVEKDGKLIAESRPVKIGIRRPGEVEILEGLQAGEKIVTHGTMKVQPGQDIAIRETDDGKTPLSGMLEPDAAPAEKPE